MASHPKALYQLHMHMRTFEQVIVLIKLQEKNARRLKCFYILCLTILDTL